LSAPEIVTLEDRKNSLLNRREVKALFRGAAGKIKKTEAAERMATQLNVDKKQVIPVNLICHTGMTDVHAVFYVYDDEKAANQLPRFRLLRTLPKEERKKILDDEKAAKLKAKPEAAASKGGAAAGGAKK
jgi:small subunit ribosomal protein S24e